MPSVVVRVISWATWLFLSREATQYSVAILALSWALLALLSAILPRSSKYVLVIMVVATFSTPPSVVVSSSSKYLPTMHPEQLNIRGQLRRILLPRTRVNRARRREVRCPCREQRLQTSLRKRRKPTTLNEAAPHYGNRPDPTAHQCEGGGQGHPCANTTAVGKLLHRSAGGGTRRSAGARVVLHQQHVQAIGVDGAHGERAVDASRSEGCTRDRQGRLFRSGGVHVQGVGPSRDLRVGRGIREAETRNQHLAASRNNVYGASVWGGVDDAHLGVARSRTPEVILVDLGGERVVGHQSHRRHGVGAAGCQLHGRVDDGGGGVAGGVDGHLLGAGRQR